MAPNLGRLPLDQREDVVGERDLSRIREKK